MTSSDCCRWRAVRWLALRRRLASARVPAIGFGSALIGEAVDYSIYYFVQSGRLGVERRRARFWPTIRLGVLTSICGFRGAALLGFPGARPARPLFDCGVLTAALVTRFTLAAARRQQPGRLR